MSGFFWGGLGQNLGQGIAAGLRANEDRKLKQEMLKLEQRKLKNDEDMQLFKVKQMERDLLDQDTQDRSIQEFGRLIGGERPAQVQTEAADPVVGAQAREADPNDLRRAMLGSVTRNQVGGVMQSMMSQDKTPTTLESLAVQHLTKGDQPGAERVLGMKPRAPMDLGNLRESLALQNFNQPTARLTPQQLAEVNKQSQQFEVDLATARAGDIAGARRTLEINTQGQDLLSPAEAGQLGVPYGTKRGGAFGKNAITTQARNTITAMGSAEAVLSQIEEAALGTMDPKTKARSGGAITATGPMSRALNAPQQFLGAASQSNPAAVRMQNLAEGLLATFSRSVGGERGATTEQDVDRARRLVPSIYDTTTIATQKLKDMRDLISEIKGRAQMGSSSVPGAPTQPPAPSTPTQNGGVPDGTRQTLGGRAFIKRGGQWFLE